MGDVLLKWAFPLLGGIVGTLMFTAPMKAVLRARKNRVLGVRFASRFTHSMWTGPGLKNSPFTCYNK